MKYYNRPKPKPEEPEQSSEAGQNETLVTGTEWFGADVDAPHDGEYLCAIRSPQACGNVHLYQRVVENKFNKWQMEGGEELVCWSKLPEIPTEYQ